MGACVHGERRFMGAGDVLDLLMSVGVYLIRMGQHDP